MTGKPLPADVLFEVNSLKLPVHILHLEENDKDSELIRINLAAEGIACVVTRVRTRQSFEEALGRGGIDLILTDSSLPSFDGYSALNIAKERRPEVPFIFVTRWFDEEAGIEAMKLGATDYVFKHRLSPRLAFAVQRALAGADEDKVRRRAEESMAETVSRYEALYDRALHCVYVHDLVGNIMDVNGAALNLLGYTRGEVLSLNVTSLIDKKQLPMAFKTINEIRERGSQKSPRQFKLRKKNGDDIWLETDACLIYRNEKPYAIQGIAFDITDRKRLEGELRRLSLIDSLTGLFNRRGFFTHAEHLMKIVSRTKNRLTLVFVDVDDLKSVNDTRGHGEGDKVLVETATFLKTVFRESDIIARIGGDEFVVLVLENGGPDETSGFVRLAANLDAFNAARNSVAPLSISVGAACYQPDLHSSIDELLAKADMLMYKQKSEKRRHIMEIGGTVSSGHKDDDCHEFSNARHERL
jgi:diguanylate cyclase (GGDEF)-like protein/PAS domain S-box-containing protein